MSNLYSRDQLEPETLRSIERSGDLRFSAVSHRDEYGCGCTPRGGDNIYLCEWHQGYDSGAEAVRNG